MEVEKPVPPKKEENNTMEVEEEEEEPQVIKKSAADNHSNNAAVEVKTAPPKKRGPGTPFRRVDPSLASHCIVKDNSFFAGGTSAWGKKAAEDLIVTRGKGFKHEKTKKKRGTYKGGAIDVNAVNSVRFPDSDDE